MKGVGGEMCECVTLDHEWGGSYAAKFSASTLHPFVAFEVVLTLDQPAGSLEFWTGEIEKMDDTHFKLYNDNFLVGTGGYLKFDFQVHYSGDSRPDVIDATMNGVDVCDGGDRWTTETPYENSCLSTGMLPYDYSQALCMSFLFYEAQRSGHLPDTQRVTWRWDSAMNDGGDVGLNLTGGYYDAGDHVKFGFPMSFTATMLAWGLIDFAEGYETAGQTDYGREALKWATDYFLEAYTAYWEFYGQVGEGGIDHGYWGRPEDMFMKRPSAKIDTEAPGSELAAETAAALAAASIVFKEDDPDYSTKMLGVAKELYDFADELREYYHNSIKDAAGFYRSWSGYGDELCWAALWLNRATGNKTYLTKAQEHWDEFTLAEDALQFSWDDKKAGDYALGSMLDPENPQYETALKAFLEYLKNDASYTPGGLVFLDEWGSNRHAANVAFISLWAAKYGDQADSEANRQWAEGQMNYIMGDAGHSFVVGFGVDPPQRPHHRSSSCPLPPASCTDGWAQNQDGPNPHVLYGALVGGPAKDGTYVDDRKDYQHNEVACDYNAAYTGALAAMIENS
ncbi:Endoglucanase E-4-like 12 [Homarus americanus]|uniref:Endoglucanase n=1 Tax=Homarus americanus TaxID=6706 RepID=A0A8J5JHQ3_HOMAM|nr:Endoglucanase E-4-like 12 [Homarus americanus]